MDLNYNPYANVSRFEWEQLQSNDSTAIAYTCKTQGLTAERSEVRVVTNGLKMPKDLIPYDLLHAVMSCEI